MAQSAEDWTFVYAAPSEGCPSERAIREGIAQLLGPQWTHEGGPVALRASIAHVDERWTLTLLIAQDGAEDRRTLEDAQCAPLADATALIGAMAIDPTVASRITTSTPVTSLAPMVVPPAPEPQRSEASARENPRQTQTQTQAPPRPSAAPRPAPEGPRPLATTAPRARWSTGLGASVDSGIAPAPAIGVSAWGALDRGGLRVELAAAFWPERYAPVPSRSTVGGYVSAYSLRASGGYFARWSGLSLGVLGSLEGAVVRGRGAGVPDVREALSPWVALALDARVEVPLTAALSLLITVGASAPLARPEFFIENVGVFFQTPWMAARGAIGVEVHF